MGRTRDLLKVIAAERPESAIIFCNTREDTTTVAKFLVRHGYDAEAISSDLSQRDRERVMKRMRARNLRFLVATDIAARGIDISDLSHVINFSFPESPEIYVHRTGRTGRAGKTGTALSLVGPREIGAFYYLKLIYKIRPRERELPTAEELVTLQEGEKYERVIELVKDKPSAEYASLAHRLWQSPEGERVVGVLLQRLFAEASRGAQAATTATAQPTTLPDRSETSERTAETDDSERRPSRDSSRRSRHRDEATEGEDDGRKRRRRRRRRDEADEDTTPMRRAPSSRSAGARRAAPEPSEASASAEPTASAEPGASAESGAPSPENAKPAAAKPKREARGRRRRGGGEVSASGTSSGDDKEFWEAWADEKAESTNPGAGADKAEDTDDENTTARLYFNVGKREEATADEIRALLGEMLGDDAAEIGSVAIRNTHSYVRVPENLVDRVIDAAKGRSFKDRELVVERARR
jgi:ATP-dependent RNA helicase DeaD